MSNVKFNVCRWCPCHNKHSFYDLCEITIHAWNTHWRFTPGVQEIKLECLFAKLFPLWKGQSAAVSSENSSYMQLHKVLIFTSLQPMRGGSHWDLRGVYSASASVKMMYSTKFSDAKDVYVCLALCAMIIGWEHRWIFNFEVMAPSQRTAADMWESQNLVLFVKSLSSLLLTGSEQLFKGLQCNPFPTGRVKHGHFEALK